MTGPGDAPGGGDARVASLALLASALAGRPMEVAAAAAGALPWTDGTTIFVDAAADSDDIVASLAVQASLVGAGSLNESVLRALQRRPELARRYLAVEGRRALAAQELLLPLAARHLLDPEMASRSGSAEDSLEAARRGDPLPPAPGAFGQIRPGAVRLPSAVADQGPAGSTRPHVPHRGAGKQLEELGDEGGDDDGPAVDFLASPVGGGGALGRLLKKLLGDARSDSGGTPGADAPTRTGGRPRRGGGAVAASTSVAPGSDPGVAGGERAFKYPEWDVHRHAYKRDWCTVEEIFPSGDGAGPARMPDGARLRRPLAPLGMELIRCRRQMQGDDIDVDAAVEALVDMKAGAVADEAVYLDSLRQRRDLSILVLLDVSGSAAEPSVTGVAVHEHQTRAAGALMVALHDLGDRVALYGFRSHGRHDVQFLRAKGFDDDMDAQALRRLAGFRPGAYTRLGAAIRHGAAVVGRDGGTSRRLLVVISDGFAYDHGYERAYGEADARRALAEARRGGVGCLCLSIGASTDAAALRRVFGTAAHAVVPRDVVLPAVVGPLFRAALASADRQRRVHQQRSRARQRLTIERSTA
ncbi:MAG TPA: VWA domain-containing protein [Acidimicrobiales bacterium]|nr:VWA domain-containing protein [Acidimicrobiales bacterium]